MGAVDGSPLELAAGGEALDLNATLPLDADGDAPSAQPWTTMRSATGTTYRGTRRCRRACMATSCRTSVTGPVARCIGTFRAVRERTGFDRRARRPGLQVAPTQ